jgi:hypothetical protein
MALSAAAEAAVTVATLDVILLRYLAPTITAVPSSVISPKLQITATNAKPARFTFELRRNRADKAVRGHGLALQERCNRVIGMLATSGPLATAIWLEVRPR